ncbi:hypothetical protein AVEN_82707-1, partial [Araneus ventricosus]
MPRVPSRCLMLESRGYCRGSVCPPGVSCWSPEDTAEAQCALPVSHAGVQRILQRLSVPSRCLMLESRGYCR